MNAPFLIGEKIYLRALCQQDLEDDYIAWLNDADVCRFNSHHVFPYGKKAAQSFLDMVTDNPAFLVCAIVRKDNDKHIGNIALQNINYISRNAEYAIILGDKNSWGQGYAKEASIMLLKHGFLELNLHRVHCGTSVRNIAMQKLAHYMVMKEEGLRRQALFKHGEFVDILEYGLLREEFLAKFNQPAVQSATVF
ncbi:GNAT family N-acetyltransferase [Candidatus Babeliales bacterium]|nr:GNAT family N-acetyltransferase [Candidatus Babeliales bacterium]